MSLIAGARLGPYEILSPLGAGGMGEVYRATDSRLNRTVAIKILSDASAADADRRERFEREAKAISALDHPNICPLYDVGEHEGIYFLVMPCLEGETLADRLAKGAIPVEPAIRYAIEIATALDAAHRHGIIHRDLKPANIMLTKTGVKLLDFGLAKLKKVEGPLGDTTMVKGTGLGTLIGTMPYMSPEQVEGRQADARSDIFSLGAVIYEMVTGHRAFKGDSPASVIGAILKDEPTAITALRPLTPAALEHLVNVCLAKDADERWQSAADIARELQWIARGAAQARLVPETPRRMILAIAVTTIAAAALAAVAWTRMTPAAALTEPARFELMPPPGAAFSASRSSIGIAQLAISPDGKQIAFVAAAPERPPSLWIRALRDLSPRELRGTDGATEPFWSPDSQSVGFFANGRLKTVDLASGAVRDVCEASRTARGASWNPEGIIVFGFDSGAGLSKVSMSTGTIEPATKTTGTTTSHRWPWFLPDGRRFLYFARGEPEYRGIYVGSLDGGEPTRIIESVFNAAYANGYLLVMKEGTLLAYPFDERAARITGDPVAIAERLSGASTQHAAFAVSATGVLAYAGAVNELSQFAWYERDGRQTRIGVPAWNIVNFRLAPDDRQVAVSRIDEATNTSDIWLIDMLRAVPSRFTLSPMNDISPVWSPDARQIVFRSDRTGSNPLYAKPTDGSAAERNLGTRDMSNPTDWSPDGRHLVFHQAVALTGLDLGVIDFQNNATMTYLASTPFEEYDGRISPDGRWLAYVSEESGAPEVYVQSFPTPANKVAVSAGGGSEPRWRRDGRELFYLAPTRRLMSVAVNGTRTTFNAETPTTLFATQAAVYAHPYQTAIEPAADGRRFLIRTATADGTARSPVTVVVNWPGLIESRP